MSVPQEYRKIADFSGIPSWRTVVMQEAGDQEIYDRFDDPEEAKEFGWSPHHSKPEHWERFNPASLAIVKAGVAIGLTHIIKDNWLRGWLFRIRCYENLLDRHFYFTEHDGEKIPLPIPSTTVLDHEGLLIHVAHVPTRDFITELRTLFTTHVHEEHAK